MQSAKLIKGDERKGGLRQRKRRQGSGCCPEPLRLPEALPSLMYGMDDESSDAELCEAAQIVDQGLDGDGAVGD
jgi:hypothetical protein